MADRTASPAFCVTIQKSLFILLLLPLLLIIIFIIIIIFFYPLLICSSYIVTAFGKVERLHTPSHRLRPRRLYLTFIALFRAVKSFRRQKSIPSVKNTFLGQNEGFL